MAEVSREAHHAELRTMDRLFADVRSTDEIIELIGGLLMHSIRID